MKDKKRYTYRSLRDEREYGLYWYSGLWHILRPVLIGITVLVLIVGICTLVWDKVYNAFLAPVNTADSGEYTFEISDGQSLNRVAANLEESELIRSRSAFKYYCDFAGMAQKLQVAIQMSAISGNAASDEDMQRFSGISTLLFSKPEVSRFLLSEMQLQQALSDIFKIVTEAADLDIAVPGIEG